MNSAGYDLVVEIHRKLYNKILEDAYKTNPILATKKGELYSYELKLDKTPTVDYFNDNHIAARAFEGRAELIEDIAEKRRILSHMFAHQERKLTTSGKTEMDPHMDRIGMDAELRGMTVGRILIEELTGKHSKDTEY